MFSLKFTDWFPRFVLVLLIHAPLTSASTPAGATDGVGFAEPVGKSAPDEPAYGVAADTVASSRDPLEAAAASRFDVSGAPGQGLTLKVGDAFSLNLRSRIQLRYQWSASAKDEGPDRQIEQLVTIGTARLWFSGNVFVPELTYMIQLAVAGRDFRDGATSPIYDAYLDWKIHRDFNVRAGQFFVPFDRLRTVREWALQMADRPRPVLELTLDRDVGVAFYSERFLGARSPVAWRLGAFGGGGTNLTRGRQPGALVVGRLELRPLGPIDDDREGDLERRRIPGLALGGGFAAPSGMTKSKPPRRPSPPRFATSIRGFAWKGYVPWQRFLPRKRCRLASKRPGSRWIAFSTSPSGNWPMTWPRSGCPRCRKPWLKETRTRRC